MDLKGRVRVSEKQILDLPKWFNYGTMGNENTIGNYGEIRT